MSNTDNTSNTENMSNMPKGDINRLKVVLVEQKRTAKWLAGQVCYCQQVVYQYGAAYTGDLASSRFYP